MPNEKTTRGRNEDRARISASDESEVKYVAKKMNVSAEQVKEAIKKVGNIRKNVEEELQKSSNEKAAE